MSKQYQFRFIHIKKVSLLAILTCLLFLGNLQFAAQGPKIKFKEEKRNFGKADQGKVLTHVFVFQNIGDSELTIKKVETTCGCAAALVSDKNVAPGKKGEIKVNFNTRGLGGKVTKYIYVESNDRSQPRKQLVVSAEIKVPPRPKIILDHYNLELGLFLDSEEVRAQTTIKNKGERELKVNCSHRNAAFFQNGKEVSFPIKIPAKGEKEIEIRMPPRGKTGVIREYVLMRSNDPSRPTLSVYLSGYVVNKKQLKELFAKYKNILD
ncbi:MAG: DUF1573 domain-containing protein [Candidatus Aminicenantes bacterium]|nr:MAG: DUF1573 domain-containing protein [Candidatus Aminicenantes bacterium]